MSKLAKVDRFFKNVNLTSDDEVFVGVDVHKKSYHVGSIPATRFFAARHKISLWS